ncbi:DUF1285 domain-containing protein [Marinobacter confluentis]|uniref:DUF1285 domain-containing protein n=1 Tax=Marinobacter confluentis TaxID=1697557 RepID=A0A4Z1BWF1_9GAMM|nr:DUF1285 domain-containing protein [Marinobacter confluentis]TGN41649.1 DUF1285 domain-containing protein [Marinobacter confluentis]
MSQKPEAIAGQIEAVAGKQSKPPLEQWHPELSGDIDIVINRKGEWLYEGKPIAREAIVRLFSTILRREADGDYYLVTPVEKWRVQVQDTPLLAHSLKAEGEGDQRQLSVTTNVGEVVAIDGDHPLSFGTYPETGEPRPVVKLPHGLEARLVTSAYYDLAELIAADEPDSGAPMGVWSHGIFYQIA